MTPLEQIPDVQLGAGSHHSTEFPDSLPSHHVGRSPFAGDDGVESQVPPEVVGQFLRATIQLLFSEDIEALVIHHDNSAWTATVGSAQRADKDPVGTAMNRVRGCVSRS